MDTLQRKAFTSLLILFLVIAALLFLTAGTIRYWQAWAYLAVFFGASFLITLYLAKNDPALLKRRLSAGPWAEKEQTQKIIMAFTSIGFLALIVAPALDFRFGWSAVPLPIVAAGNALVLAVTAQDSSGNTATGYAGTSCGWRWCRPASVCTWPTSQPPAATR